jgi:hypothetical protein
MTLIVYLVHGNTLARQWSSILIRYTAGNDAASNEREIYSLYVLSLWNAHQ